MKIMQVLAAATRRRAGMTPALSRDLASGGPVVAGRPDAFDEACALTVPDAKLVEVLQAAHAWRRPPHFGPLRPDREPAPGTPPTAMDSLVVLPSWMRRDGVA